MQMKSSYKTIGEFLSDAHELLSIRDLAVALGIYTKKDMQSTVVCCCFHEDDTPSLQISDRFFRCYAGSCGVRGDIITFLQTYYNVGFMEAVKKLADVYGIDISSARLKLDHRANDMKQEWEWYLNQMESAPKEAKALQRDFFPQEIGYDPKIAYVVLPMTSKTGSILGFTKRRVDTLNERNPETGKFRRPKWEHSKLDGSLLSQCHNLFNLHNAARRIKQANSVVVCEGPKDVIAWRRAGIEYAVGVCGTSNSNNIWDLLLPVESIYLSMDGDDVGIGTVVNNAIYLAKMHDITEIRAMIFPKDMDPYDVVVDPDMGVDALKRIYSQAISVAEFVIRFGSQGDVRDLYAAALEYNKTYVVGEVCRVKGFSLKEAESWLGFNGVNEAVRSSKYGKLGEKEALIAIATCDLEHPALNGDNMKLVGMDPQKAVRILKMKYGIDVSSNHRQSLLFNVKAGGEVADAGQSVNAEPADEDVF